MAHHNSASSSSTPCCEKAERQLQEEDDLDRDTELDEYTALTLDRTSSASSSAQSHHQGEKSSSRSPSRMLIGAISGVFAPRSPSSLSVLSGSGSNKNHMNSDEVQILIEPASNSGPDDSASTTSSALDSFTICSASSSSGASTTGTTFVPNRSNRFIVTTTNATCIDGPGFQAGLVSNGVNSTSSTSSKTLNTSRQSHPQPRQERRVHHLSRPSRIASCMSVQSMDSVASSTSSLSDYPPGTPICKFCHQRARANDPLISPCHCKGTIRYMHCRCLMKWLEKLKKRNSRHQPLACEICNYQYRWKKKFKPTREWQLPPCLGNDRQWHTVFVICALLMLISMINLVVFSDDPVTGYGGSPRHRGGSLSASHQYQYPAIRFPASHIVQKVTRNGVSTKPQPAKPASPPVLPVVAAGKAPAKDSNSQSSTNPNATAPATSTNTLNTGFHNDPEVQHQINTLLLGNLSALRSFIQQSARSNHSATSKEGVKVFTLETVSETIDTLFQQQRLKMAAAAANRGESSPSAATGSDTAHYLYHSHRTRAHRKNTPTRPSEVILVVSGCLFFITFFLGTFAQIKSEVSFYTMVVRFIQWNQQWIIEEYDPDGGNGEFDLSDTESLKDFAALPSHSSTVQSVVDAQPTQSGRQTPSEHHLTVVEPGQGSPKNSSVCVHLEMSPSRIHSPHDQQPPLPPSQQHPPSPMASVIIAQSHQLNPQPEVINL